MPPDMWEEDRVRQLLTAKGAVLHALVGVHRVAPGLPEYNDWRYTEDDLAAIAPPLTNILNRYDVTRAAAAAGDEAAVAVGFGGYVIRSYMTRRAVLAQLAEFAEPEPVTGVGPQQAPRPAPEPTEPRDDVDPGGLSWTT